MRCESLIFEGLHSFKKYETGERGTFALLVCGMPLHNVIMTLDGYLDFCR